MGHDVCKSVEDECEMVQISVSQAADLSSHPATLLPHRSFPCPQSTLSAFKPVTGLHGQNSSSDGNWVISNLLNVKWKLTFPVTCAFEI